ncbi:ATP-binding protein [Streptomyces sp. NPDC002928]|uniref:ATP-binding protein n=1 Tax=Streptomyces sp. NPDC002928 TaxID=3154440 RepID=UPI0033BEB4D5
MARPLEESPYAFTVPALVKEVPAARDRVVGRARSLGLPFDEDLTHDLKLLTGELVANSVRHARSACVVCVKWTGERLRVEVTDVDPDPVTLTEALPTDEHGRGLFLVAALAAAWGSEPCTAGKTTWFELDVPCVAEAFGGASPSGRHTSWQPGGRAQVPADPPTPLEAQDAVRPKNVCELEPEVIWMVSGSSVMGG